DVLVVDEHALEPVDFLDLVDEVARKLFHALDGQDVVRGRVAVEDILALLDGVAFLQVERLALRDQVLDGLDALLGRLDDDPALVLVVAAEADRAVDLGNDRVILRTTSLEQLGHTRQTAGDVLGLGALERDTREHVAGGHLLAGLDRDNRIDREQIPGLAATIELDDGVAALDRDGRLERVVALAAAPIHDHTLGEAG